MDELLDAYSKYSSACNFKFTIIHASDGHKIVKIQGNQVGKAFCHETGKHCVQRIPVTDSKGKKQTSIVSVGVLPIKKQLDVFIPESEIEITTQRGHGPGGQNINKRDNCVRAVHKPTQIVVVINGRDQWHNKKDAIETLTARVVALYKSQHDANYDLLRKESIGNGGRSDKTRTYNFVRNEITDHVMNKKTGNVKAFMKGQFSVLFEKNSN